MFEPSAIPLKPVQHQPQAPWQMCEAATVDGLQQQRQTIWQTYKAGLVDANKTTVSLLRVGIALQRAHRARGLT
jgi:hypothetical protein